MTDLAVPERELSTQSLTLEFPNQLPTVEAELIAYGKKMLAVVAFGEMAAEEFGRVCYELEKAAWKQSRIATEFGCTQQYVSKVLKMVRPSRPRDNSKNNNSVVNSALDVADGGTSASEEPTSESGQHHCSSNKQCRTEPDANADL